MRNLEDVLSGPREAGSSRGGCAAEEPPPGEALPAIWSIYYRQGYEEGYRRAVKDLLASLLAMSERFIDDHRGSAQDAR